MPLYVKHCECGHEFEVLTTVRHSTECPKCGSENTKNIPQLTANFVYTQVLDSSRSSLVHQAHMRRKKQLDARTGDIKSGELDLKLQGPKEYWPDVTKEKTIY